jgi:alkaline phosphatase
MPIAFLRMNMKKFKMLEIGIIFILLTTAISVAGGLAEGKKNSVKNVILIIPDGMGLANSNLGRWYQEGKPLFSDEIVCGLVRNYSANSLVTDSAAAGTAYATGHKADNETISIYPKDVSNPLIDQTKPENVNKPLVTILEGARLAGKSTGLVAKSELYDATPAVFGSHIDNRDLAEPIAEQMVYDGIDVLFAGGGSELVPGKEKNNRKDGENLIAVLKKNGYDYVTNKKGMNSSKSNKVWGIFNDGTLFADIDRDPEVQPSLSEMTQKALEVLSKNGKGFFLMVEASEIDWFAHDNDPVGIATEVIEWDKAVKTALDFAKKDGNTAVISCADHATGGLYLQSHEPMKNLVDILKKAKCTSYKIPGLINEKRTNIKEVVAEYYGLSELSDVQVDKIKESLDDNLSPVIGHMIADKASITFSTDGHTGEEIALYAYHPADFKPTDFVKSGVIQNNEVNKYMQYILEIDLEALNQTTFASESDIRSIGGTVSLDRTDPNNLIIAIKKGNDRITLPVNKNIAIVNNNETKMKALSLVVGGNIWVAREILDFLK